MDNFIYSTIDGYFNTLEKTGYVNNTTTNGLLVLVFLFNLIYHDYRGYISQEDYKTIERALNCLYGTNCLISYPDYLKMGKLRLGEITELAQRVRTLEETEVLKTNIGTSEDSDVQIIEEDNK